MFRRTRSIRVKLASLIAISVGAAALLSFAVSGARELSRFGEAKHAELQATAEVLATSVADAVASADQVEAARTLSAIGRIPDVKYAEIRAPSGAIFATVGAGVALVLGDAPGAGSSTWRMLWRGSFFVAADIVRGGRHIGTLVLLVDTSKLFARLVEILGMGAVSAAGAIGVGLLIAARLQRSITRPLLDLAAMMNRVRANNDFTLKAERNSEDETGQLVDAFNDMLGQIQNRDTDLEAHRAGLERTVEDRTRELADARDIAKSANRAKSDFLATMSHEIRTPMNGMLVMAELLAGTELHPRQQRYAETIVRSGQTLLAVINDILDLSKIEAGKMELEQGRVAPATLIEDVLGLFWGKAASKSIDLAADLDVDVPAVIEGDPVRLSQVLSNLVGNALKFTEHGHVKVSVRRLDGTETDRADLLFTVEDTGVGIAADKVESIFEAFSQADQSTTRRFGGTGLGLSICRKLVLAMGGRIWAESSPGEGSRFHFTIGSPVLEPAGTASARPGKRALIEVQGEATADALRSALRSAGYATRPGEPGFGPIPQVVFAGDRWIEANAAMLGQLPARPTVICVAGVGERVVDRLLAEGLADGFVMQPVVSTRAREILDAIEVGELSLLLEARNNARPELPDLSGLRVLVADDSPVNREVVTEALNRLSVHTTTVQDGAHALKRFAHERFDVVLMDCSMPVMDGFAATRAIRAQEMQSGLRRTPVLALTAHVAGSAADDWREAGMDDYLTKPFTIRSLAERLMRWSPGPVDRSGDPRGHGPPAPQVPPAGASSPLDADVLGSLRAIAAGNGAILRKIFAMFQAHAPARLAALKEAVRQGDAVRAASEAHAIKSPSHNVGALRLGALCGELEAKARGAPLEALTAGAVDAIEGELTAVLAALDRECAEDQPTTSSSGVDMRVA